MRREIVICDTCGKEIEKTIKCAKCYSVHVCNDCIDTPESKLKVGKYFFGDIEGDAWYCDSCMVKANELYEETKAEIDAIKEQKRLEQIEKDKALPCPYCGAKMEIDLEDTEDRYCKLHYWLTAECSSCYGPKWKEEVNSNEPSLEVIRGFVNTINQREFDIDLIKDRIATIVCSGVVGDRLMPALRIIYKELFKADVDEDDGPIHPEFGK